MVENMYGILFHFGRNDRISKEHLINKFSKDVFDEVLENGFIRFVGKNSDGVDLYSITVKGIEYRDR